MLVRLLIKNYALIDNLDIEFNKGLNIITGETGAGKSILMGALGLILGNRVEGKAFFDDTKKCVIEGYFNIESYELSTFFNEQDLEYDQLTIIRREISLDGKSRAFVNDSPVTLNALKSLGEKLIDIHSQHATLQINTEEFQFFVLDALAKNHSLLEEFQQEYKKLKALDKKLTEAKEELKKAHAELDYNQFLFDELDKLNIHSGELKALEEEQQHLENAEEIKRGLLGTNYLLEEADQNVLSALKDSMQQLNTIGKYFSEAETLVKRIESVFIELKDISNEISIQESAVSLNEKRLDEVNSRLSEVYTLLKKHHFTSEDELIALKDSLSDKLELALHHDELLEKLAKERLVLHKQVIDLANTIHLNRTKSIPKLESSVQDTLAHVGMQNAKLTVSLSKLEDSKLNNKGINSIQFLFSANKGQTQQPIHKVASGGELSRVMLAIKSLVAQNSALPTIIFDEIDTGISGEVALRVGEVMQGLSSNMQVIAITHLPQIASKGNSHFKVFKKDVEEKSYSNIQLLSDEGRVLEIAQMLSGANPGEAALVHAKELLNNNYSD